VDLVYLSNVRLIWHHHLAIEMLNLFKKLRGGAMVGIGYMLSPLSWWNDLFFNLPIALVFGYAVAWLHSDWFLPGTIAGYWLSNVIGILMMQFGAMDMFVAEEERNLKRDLLIGFGGSTLYTIIVSMLVYFHILAVPDFVMNLHP
jgi:hypothetical protein